MSAIESTSPPSPIAGKRARAVARREQLYSWLVAGNLGDTPIAVDTIAELYFSSFPVVDESF